jgi:hypothetical protein
VKLFRSPKWRSKIALVTAAMMLAPMLALPRAAQAQRTILSVYILDFNNKTTVGAQLLGRMASAQMSLQLRESQNWDIIPDAQVQRRMQELNIKPPYDRVNRVQIGNGVDASAVIYGSVTEARVTSGATPQAYVRIQVVVEDLITGVLINGAIAEGLSTPRMGYSGDADILLEEALGKAAFKAREFMDRFRLPEGTVLNTTAVGTDDKPRMEAMLNIGLRQGVRRGMEMIVTRLKETVGKLKITRIDSDLCTAEVTDNLQGVKPEDRVRAIFTFSDFAMTRTKLRSAVPDAPVRTASLNVKEDNFPKEKGTEPVRIAKADRSSTLTPFAAPQEGGPRLAQSGVPVPPPVVVDEPEVEREERSVSPAKRLLGGGTLRMLVGGLLVMGILAVGGRGGTSATRAHGVDASGFQLEVGAPGAFIKVQWDRPKAVRSTQVLQYVLWRTDTTTPLQIVAALDGDGSRQFIDNEATRTVNAFDGDPGDVAGDRAEIEDVPGIVPGVQYRYQVATAYRNGLEDRDNPPDDEPDDEDFMSPLSSSSPWITAIRPATIVAPQQSQEVQLDELTLTWQQTEGADTYLVWISKNSNFSPDKRVEFGPFRVLPVDQGGDPEITRTFDARSPKLKGSQFVYISVGSRNSSDRNKPRPFGAIFSGAVRVRNLTGPPNPPTVNGGKDGNKRDRGNDDRGSKGKGKRPDLKPGDLNDLLKGSKNN